ncbi:MAG: glycosyltransferase [Anaerolineae bacterium]|nr:glycosyltransferase [Anaerolineae bacterium]
MERTRVCWLGGTRYAQPLSGDQARKWTALAPLADLWVIGFATGLRPRRFTQSAHFYLLPEFPLALLRHLTMFAFAPMVLLWIVWRHRVRVVIAQSPYEGAIGAFVKQLVRFFGLRLALVVENHGDFVVSLFQQRRVVSTSLYKRLMAASAAYALRHADVLRAVSNTAREQIETLAPETTLFQFMAWVDSQTFQETPRTCPLSQTQDVVYAGVLIPRKAVDVLIDAFACAAHVSEQARLYLVGKPDNVEYAQQLRAQVERLGLRDRVVFAGEVSRDELARYMGRARVLVLPSYSEGLARVLVEAMMCGTPVIGTRVSGTPEVIREGENGYLVPAGDAQALCAALEAVLRDPNIEAMGARARAFAQEFFSEASYVEGHRQMIAVALAARAAPGQRQP